MLFPVFEKGEKEKNNQTKTPTKQKSREVDEDSNVFGFNWGSVNFPLSIWYSAVFFLCHVRIMLTTHW